MKGTVVELKDGRVALISTYQPLKEVDKIILTIVDKDTFTPLKNEKGDDRVLIRNLQGFKEAYKDGLTVLAQID